MKKLLTILATAFITLTSCDQTEQSTIYRSTAYYDIKIIEGTLQGSIVKNVLRSDKFNVNDTVNFDGDKAVIINKTECNLCK